jgi:two-component system alkaline phosphatase synthesis response regulator PhoP
MPKKIPLLLVEDEENLGATLKELLEGEHYAVTWAKDKKNALVDIKAIPFDIALLDVNLPDGTGFQVAESLQNTAMIFLTAMSDPEHRVRGLQLGAEDYIVKPFHFQELTLRIKNALKRKDYIQSTSPIAQIGSIKVDFTRFTLNDKPLAAKEAKLLKLLYDRRGKVVSRDEILNHVWPRETYPTARTVDNFISKLRKLLGPDSIKSIRSVGYQLREE